MAIKKAKWNKRLEALQAKADKTNRIVSTTCVGEGMDTPPLGAFPNGIALTTERYNEILLALTDKMSGIPHPITLTHGELTAAAKIYQDMADWAEENGDDGAVEGCLRNLDWCVNLIRSGTKIIIMP